MKLAFAWKGTAHCTQCHWQESNDDPAGLEESVVLHLTYAHDRDARLICREESLRKGERYLVYLGPKWR